MRLGKLTWVENSQPKSVRAASGITQSFHQSRLLIVGRESCPHSISFHFLLTSSHRYSHPSSLLVPRCLLSVFAQQRSHLSTHPLKRTWLQRTVNNQEVSIKIGELPCSSCTRVLQLRYSSSRMSTGHSCMHIRQVADACGACIEGRKSGREKFVIEKGEQSFRDTPFCSLTFSVPFTVAGIPRPLQGGRRNRLRNRRRPKAEEKGSLAHSGRYEQGTS